MRAVISLTGICTIHCDSVDIVGSLNEWAEIVPAEFDIYPLIDPEAIKSFLATDA